MVIKIQLASHEVQSILLQHVREQFQAQAGKDKVLEVARVGEAPPAFECTVEAKRRAPDPRD